jgi:TolB protein
VPNAPQELLTGRLVVSGSVGGPRTIYTIGADGTDLRQVTSNLLRPIVAGDSGHTQPEWSPDGTRIAFVHQILDASYAVGWQASIYTVSADGSDLRRLSVPGSMDFGPQWSPDGASIAYTGFVNGEQGIYVMNADGSGAVRLTPPETKAYLPAWSPAGDRIAFSMLTGGSGDDLYVMNRDGSNITRITNDERLTYELHPSWSPDGTRIAFLATGAQGRNVSVVRLDGMVDFRVPLPAKDNEGSPIWFGAYPSWSSDGQRILFQTCGAENVVDDGVGCKPIFWMVSVPSKQVYAVPMPGGYTLHEPAWRP